MELREREREREREVFETLGSRRRTAAEVDTGRRASRPLSHAHTSIFDRFSLDPRGIMLNFWQTLTEGFNGTLKADRSMTAERNEEELRRMHEEWMVKYEQTYANAEEKERRFVLFKESAENCDRFREQYKGCTFAPGWLADRTKEEKDAIMPPHQPMVDNRWKEGMIVTRTEGGMTVTKRDVSKPPNCGEGCSTGRDVVSET